MSVGGDAILSVLYHKQIYWKVWNDKNCHHSAY